MIQLLSRYYSDLNHIIYHAIMICGIVVGIKRFRVLTNSSQTFLLLLVLTPLFELLAWYSAVKFHNNAVVYTPFNIVQFLLICCSFYVETRAKVIWVLFFSLLGFTVFNGLTWEPIFKVQANNMIMLEYLFTIIIYFIFLTTYFKTTDLGRIDRYPLFWIGFGWLIFSINSIISFGFSKVYEPGDIYDHISVWTRKFSNYLLYFSFIISFVNTQQSLTYAISDKK